jgi:iron complex outermembrane receptor protein
MIGGTSPRFGGSAVVIATTSDFQGEATFDRLTPRLVLNWKPIENQLAYVSYSEGFKGGGFDPRGQSSRAPDLDGDGTVEYAEIFEFMGFEPETVNAVELGLKSVLLDGRINSRLAVFWSDYTDVQIPGSLAVDSDGDGIDDQFVGTTTNAASADIKGAEWEGQAILAQDLGRPESLLRLGWAIGYLDAEFNEFIDDEGNDVADVYQFRNSPDWTISGLLSYEMPTALFQRDGSLLIINSLAYRGDTIQFERPTSELNQPAYTLWDLSVVWTEQGGRWSLGVHGKNLGDEEYKTAGFYAPTLGQEGNITAFYGNPRQFWATLQYQLN